MIMDRPIPVLALPFHPPKGPSSLTPRPSQVQPLRIAKGAHSSAAKATPGPPRALSEISPSENRRNSLNLTQTTPTKVETSRPSLPPFLCRELNFFGLANDASAEACRGHQRFIPIPAFPARIYCFAKTLLAEPQRRKSHHQWPLCFPYPN